MMTKREIVRAVLHVLHLDGDSLPTGDTEAGDLEEYAEVVEITLAERLPDVAFLTCDDFGDLHVTCCDACHTSHPHYDMYVEEVNGGAAWICCAVRSAYLMMKSPPGQH